MDILGLFVHAGQSAAALIRDGKVIASIAEERLDRIKQSRAFPIKAMKYCMKVGGIDSVEQLDAIAVPWNPAENMRHINMSGFTQWRRYDPEWLYIVPNHILGAFGTHSFSGKVMKLDIGEEVNCPIYFVNHHMTHMALATCQSSFDDGLFIVADEYGEYNSVTVGTFEKNQFEIVKEIAYPNSLGVFYAAFTEFLGFRPNSDEWKLMGAAAYGSPEKFKDRMEQLLEWDDKRGEWILDTRFIEHSNMKRAGYLNERLVELMGIPVKHDNKPLEQVYYDVAAAAQYVFEKRIFQLTEFYARKTGKKNLVAAGGCFMNSLANGKIIENTSIKKIFIPYAAADNGGAMGAPLYVYNYVMNQKRELAVIPPSPYLGPEYTNDEIEQTLNKFKIKYKKPANIITHTAEALADGTLIGWFQGRMEFGERALGNRSIIADPRNSDMKEKINAAVKYREAFRPFAPSVLSEDADDYFELPPGVMVPYMEQVYRIKESKQHMIPAVVHNDGTGRLQTVEKETNPRYHELISAFKKISGIPVILNTSFNVQGEPIVCSPEDAIRCFFSCGLDMLVIGDFVIEK